MSLPVRNASDVVHISVDQMRHVDDQLEAGGVGPIAVAEGAGRGLVNATRDFIARPLNELHVVVGVGPGGNGNGGWKAARMLLSAGAQVTVLRTTAPSLPQSAVSDGTTVVGVDAGEPLTDVYRGDVFLDAMLGFGAAPPLRGAIKTVAEWVAQSGMPIVALDQPSGLNGDTGEHGGSVIADATVSVGLPKHGFKTDQAKAALGLVYLADLGIPHHMWANAEVASPGGLFAEGPLVRIDYP